MFLGKYKVLFLCQLILLVSIEKLVVFSLKDGVWLHCVVLR